MIPSSDSIIDSSINEVRNYYLQHGNLLGFKIKMINPQQVSIGNETVSFENLKRLIGKIIHLSDQNLPANEFLRILNEAIPDKGLPLFAPLPYIRVPIDQDRLLNQFLAYLELSEKLTQKPLDKSFIQEEQGGDCWGLGFLFQVYESQNKGNEFFKILGLISAWDGSEAQLRDSELVSSLSDHYVDLEDLIKQTMNDIIWLQAEIVNTKSVKKEFLFKVISNRITPTTVLSEVFKSCDLEQFRELITIYQKFDGYFLDLYWQEHFTCLRFMPEGGAIRYYDPNLSQPLAPFLSIDQFIRLLQLTLLKPEGLPLDRFYFRESLGYFQPTPVKTFSLEEVSSIIAEFTPSKNGFTPYHLAILLQSPEYIRKLNKEAPELVNHANVHGTKPLDLVIYSQNLELLRALLENPSLDLSLAYKTAIDFNNAPALKELLESGKVNNLNEPRSMEDGLMGFEMPLIASLKLGRVEMLDLFLQHGADANCADVFGATFFELFSQSKNPDIWEAVVKHLPNVRVRDSKGLSLFQYAINNGNQALYDFLFSKV